MLNHSEYICDVLEEIIIYNKKTEDIVGMIAIVECAKNDLAKIVKTMVSEEDSRKNVEFFSEGKIKYFTLKAMEAMAYLH